MFKKFSQGWERVNKEDEISLLKQPMT